MMWQTLTQLGLTPSPLSTYWPIIYFTERRQRKGCHESFIIWSSMLAQRLHYVEVAPERKDMFQNHQNDINMLSKVIYTRKNNHVNKSLNIFHVRPCGYVISVMNDTNPTSQALQVLYVIQYICVLFMVISPLGDCGCGFKSVGSSLTHLCDHIDIPYQSGDKDLTRKIKDRVCVDVVQYVAKWGSFPAKNVIFLQASSSKLSWFVVHS